MACKITGFMLAHCWRDVYADVMVGIMYVLFVDYSRDRVFNCIIVQCLLGIGVLGNARFRSSRQIRS